VLSNLFAALSHDSYIGAFSGNFGNYSYSIEQGSFQNFAISGYYYSNDSSSSIDKGSQEPSFKIVKTYFLAYFFS
jgi:hypothetical protein